MELIKVAGRRHTRLENADVDCHIYSKQEYDALAAQGALPEASYYVLSAFNPVTLQHCGPVT